jgi:hypothetical protein
MEVYLTLNAVVRAVHREESAQNQTATGVEFVGLTDQERLYLTNMVYQNLLKDVL